LSFASDALTNVVSIMHKANVRLETNASPEKQRKPAGESWHIATLAN